MSACACVIWAEGKTWSSGCRREGDGRLCLLVEELCDGLCVWTVMETPKCNDIAGQGVS